MKVVLAGNGKMATAVANECNEQNITFLRYEDEEVRIFSKTNGIAIIHFGSGRQLPHLIKVSRECDIPLIQGSTNDQSREEMIAECASYAKIVFAPNLAPFIIKFMQAFPQFAQELITASTPHLLESHQGGKKDVSGTARKLADGMGVGHSMITKIRERTHQLALGVPLDHLDGHGYHLVTFEAAGVKLEVNLKAHGRSAYAKGALNLAYGLTEGGYAKKLESGVTNLEDIPEEVYLGE